MKLLNNVSPDLFTTSAFAIGIVLSENMTINELNAVGNWLMLIGQTLETVASQKQLLGGNIQGNINAQSQIDIMNKVVNTFNQEINNLKK